MLMSRICERSRDGKVPFIWFWPEGAESCVMITHDVEERAGLDFCGHLMDVDQAFGVPASFQIIPEERYTLPTGFLRELVRRGFEVNVQDLNHDGRLFQDRAEFERRAVRIEQYRREFGASGFRSAVLYRNQDWYDQLQFRFDMSVPNVAHLEPQRGGCCTVMPYFVGRTLELPLTTTQDYTLFHILGDYSISLWEQQVDLILRRNGLISFLVHPDYIRTLASAWCTSNCYAISIISAPIEDCGSLCRGKSTVGGGNEPPWNWCGKNRDGRSLVLVLIEHELRKRPSRMESSST